MFRYPDNEIYDIRSKYQSGELGYDTAVALLIEQHGFDEVKADEWLFS